MAGHIELRHNADATIPGVRDDVADLGLGVVFAIGPPPLQQRIPFAFDAKSLVVGQVPVEDIQLYRGHAIKGSFHATHRNKVARNIQRQPAPPEPRLVLNIHGGRCEAVRTNAHQLQKRLKAANRSEGFRRNQFHRIGLDRQAIRLIIAILLYPRLGMLDGNEKRRSVFYERKLLPDRNAGLAIQVIHRLQNRGLHARIAGSGPSNSGAESDHYLQLAGPQRNVRRPRHQRQIGRGLRGPSHRTTSE